MLAADVKPASPRRLAAKVVLFALWQVLLVGSLWASKNYNYLLFHTIAEVFAIVIACGIFMVAWNARRFLNNGYLMIMGVASLSMACMDFAHTLAYKGMSIFPTLSDPNAATQLWIGARSVGVLSLLAAPFFLRFTPRVIWLFVGYATVTAVLLLTILLWRVFPTCFVAGQGLTSFKIWTEYVICAGLLVAIALLLRNRSSFEPTVIRHLVASIAVTIASELAFTLYMNVYGVANFLGHYLKILSFYFLYKAVIQTGFARPFDLLLRENILREKELRRATEELDRANAELEDRVRERTASLQETTDNLNTFVYSIAHDFRAPLRAQHGFANMLLESHRHKLDADAIGFFEKVARAAVKLDGLVSDLLGYVTVSRERPPVTEVDLRSVVSQACAQFTQQIAEQKAVVDTLAVEGFVIANHASLQRALWHLLDNGLKFSKTGQPPIIRMRTEKRDGYVRLWVEDEGIGIAPQYHDKLFGVFQRLHRDGSYSGHGIGLAIVRKSVEMMGGNVGVESELNAGCSFWIDLRQAEPAKAPAPGV